VPDFLATAIDPLFRLVAGEFVPFVNNVPDMSDALVEMCRKGQGQIGSERVRDGVWNRNATKTILEDQHEINVFFNRLSKADRDIIARMLEQEVVTGVFETLKVLEEFKVPPFEERYEGSPFIDFIGRLDDWQ
jgi:hypothetical protein